MNQQPVCPQRLRAERISQLYTLGREEVAWFYMTEIYLKHLVHTACGDCLVYLPHPVYEIVHCYQIGLLKLA